MIRTKKKFKLLTLAAIAVFTAAAVLGVFGFAARGGGFSLEPQSAAPHARQTGVSQRIVNTVIFARFAGEPEWVDEDVLYTYERKYNTSDISVRSYWEQMSFGYLDFETRFVAYGGGSFEVSRPRRYFRPRYREINGAVASPLQVVNPDGYNNRVFTSRQHGDRPHIDVMYRRQSLLLEIFEGVKHNIDTVGINNSEFSGDDGLINSVTFVFGGSPDDWGNLLWPHQFRVFFGGENLVNNQLAELFYIPQGYWNSHDRNVFMAAGQRRVQLPNFNPLGSSPTVELDGYMMMFDSLNRNVGQGDTGQVRDGSGHNLGHLGVAVHETAHILGMPDLYNYADHNNNPMGRWDLMDNTTPMPQTLNAYFRHRMGWLTDANVPWIRHSGTFSITASAVAGPDDVIAYRIISPVYSHEYFMVEFRARLGPWDGGQFERRDGRREFTLPGEGLIVYRVDENVRWGEGNMHGPPNLLEVMRGGRAINDAHLDGARNTSIGSREGVFDASLLSFQGSRNRRFAGWNSQIRIYNVRINGDMLTFNVDMPTQYEAVSPPAFGFPLLCGGIGGDMPPWQPTMWISGVLFVGLAVVKIRKKNAGYKI